MSNDTINVQRGIVGAGSDNDTYVLSANLIEANAQITISDVEGDNQIQLIGGLEIVSSIVAGDTAQLTLSNGAVVTVLGASSMSYEVGGNPLDGTPGVTKDYSTFAADVLGTTVPAAGEPNTTGGVSTVNADGTATGGTPVDPNAPTYALAAAAATVDEGADATFTLTTTNVAEGTVVAYTLTGVDAADVDALTGTATVGADGTATITVAVTADATTETAETLTVTIDGQTANASVTVNDTSLTPVAAAFTLTVADDEEVISTTAASEVIDATESGSLQADDIILDTSTTDADVLNAVITASDTDTRITNIETINLDGEFITTGFDFKNTSNAQVANLNTGIVGGTATVLGANSLNVAKLVAGSNIATLNVTSLSSGTRDTVDVDAGAASTINITGNANGADSYTVTAAKDAEVNLGTLNSSNDAISLNLAGDIELNSTGNSTELDVTIESSVAAEVVLNKAAAAAAAEKMILAGTNDITLVSTDGTDVSGASLTAGTEISSTTTGTSTLEVESLDHTASNLFGKAMVDVLEVSGAATGVVTALTLNQNTKLNLTADLGNATTVALDNGDDDKTFATGTLRVDISDTQTAALTTAATVETMIVAVTPDKATDLDIDENGSNETTMTVADITLDAASKVVVVNGDNDLVITDMSFSADKQVLSASQLNGGLTVTGASVGGAGHELTIVGSANSDSITTTGTAIFDVQGGAGNDTLNITGAAATTEVTAGEGDDTVTSSSTAVTVDLGAGNDTFTAAGSDTVTLGEGTDSINLADQLADVVISDFVKGTDVVTLTTGVATANIDFTDVTVTDGVYKVADANGTLADNEWHITLKNNGSKLTATDMSDSFRAYGVTLLDGSTNVLGDLDDLVGVAADESATITTGTGEDSVEVTVGAANSVTIKDFTVGSDKIVLTDAITVDLSVNLKNVSDTSGTYLIGDATLGASIKLENGGNDLITDNDLTGMVQLGSTAAAFIAETTTASVAGETVSGGQFNDHVQLIGFDATKMSTYNFGANGGVDTIDMVINTEAAGTITAGFSQVNFNALAGIDTSTASKVDVAANAAKTADAVDAAAYVFASSADGAGNSKIITFVKDEANGYTQDVIDTEVAAFLDANLGVSAGESYIAVINDKSTTAYGATDYGTGTQAAEAYVYLVTGDADGIQTDNVTLIGMLEDSAADVAGFTSYDIA